MNNRRRKAGMGEGAALAALTLAFAPLASSAAAQGPAIPSSREVLFLSAADMAKETTPGSKVLGSGPTYRYQTFFRDKSGEIEIHDNFNDIIVIQEGRAEVLLGGTVTGNRTTGPGEHRGGTAIGARAQMLAPGDVLFIPAGMPHLMNLPDGVKRFRYLVVKTQP